MGKYSVPEHIRAMKPKGTMVKAIGGRYYVYEYRSVVEDGKRKTKMGRCIGKIEEGVGFVPNDAAAVSDALVVPADPRDAEIARLRARVDELESALRAISETVSRAVGA